MTSMLDALKLLQQKGEQAANAAQPGPAEQRSTTSTPASHSPAAEAVDTSSATGQTRDQAVMQADLTRAAALADQELEALTHSPQTGTPKQPQQPTTTTATTSTSTDRATESPVEPANMPALGGTEIAGLGSGPAAPPATGTPARSTQQPAARGTDRRKRKASQRARERRAARRQTAAPPAKKAQPLPLPPDRRTAAPMKSTPPPVAIRTVRPRNAIPPAATKQPATFADKLTDIKPDGSIHRPTPPVTPSPATPQDATKTVPFEVVPQTKDGPVKQPDVHPISQVASRKKEKAGAQRSTTKPTSDPPALKTDAAPLAGPIESAAAAAKKLLTIGATLGAPTTDTDTDETTGRRYFEEVLNDLRDVGLRTEYRDLWNHIDRQQSDRSILFVDCEEEHPAAEVMVYLAGSGKDSRSILLIDADRQSRRLTRLLRCEHDRGLTDCPDLQEMGLVLQGTGLPSTKFLPIGQNTGDVTSQHMAFILSELTNSFDFAFIAGGTTENGLLEQVQRVCGDSYLVVRLGTTMRETAINSLRSFGTMGIPIGGCIVANSLADPTNR